MTYKIKPIINKTWMYLLPCLRAYGDKFVDAIQGVSVVQVFVYDNTVQTMLRVLDENEKSKKASVMVTRPSIYIMLDNESKDKKALDDLLSFSSINYHLPKQIFKECINGEFMVVIDIPENYHHSYFAFLDGKYSTMYSKEENEIFFNNYTRKRAYKVVTKNKEVEREMVKKLNITYGTTITELDKDAEFEFPPIASHEIYYSNNDEAINTKKHLPLIYNKWQAKEQIQL